MKRRPMFVPPSGVRMFASQGFVYGCAGVAGVFVALFMFGWITP